MRNSAPLLLVLVLVVAGIAGLFALNDGASNRKLDNSVIGLSGLARFLDQHDVAYKRSHARLSPHILDLGLRVMPLYDLDTLTDITPPEDEPGQFYQADMRDIHIEDLQSKLQELPSLVVLPKWVQGTITQKIAHPKTLIPVERYWELFSQMGLGKLDMSRGAHDMVQDGQVSLFLPQTFVASTLPDACQPLRMFGDGVLVAECVQSDTDDPFYLLSDPDLINNHGLAVGQNGRVVLDLIDQLAPPGGRPVYIDTSPYLLTAIDEDREERRDYVRTASDFARFFAQPFDVLWAMLLIVTGILLWRGSVRFGPVLPDDDTRPEQSKSEAIATHARLLRLTGHDGHLVADFVQHQLTDLSRQTFGASAGQAGLPRYFAFLARRDAALADAFQTSAMALIKDGPNMSRARLYSELATYRTLLESVTDANDPR